MQSPSSTHAPITPTAGSAVAEVAQPGACDAAQSDRRQALVDDAVGGEHPTPGDAGGDERDDLRQEQHGPPGRADPPRCHPPHHSRDDQTEYDRDAGEEDDQLEGVFERADKLVVGEDGLEVVEPGPLGRGDTVPAVERVPEGLDDWPEHEKA